MLLLSDYEEFDESEDFRCLLYNCSGCLTGANNDSDEVLFCDQCDSVYILDRKGLEIVEI